jgi:hypothetical protein
MDPEQIAADRAEISRLRQTILQAGFMVKEKLAEMGFMNIPDRWSVALDAVEKLQGNPQV